MQEGQYELAAELLRFIVPPGDDSGAVGLEHLKNGRSPASRSSSGINGQVGHQIMLNDSKVYFILTCMRKNRCDKLCYIM